MIRSTANPKVRLAQAVREGRHRDLLLVEGERGVMEAAASGLEFEVLLAAIEMARELERELPCECPRPLVADPKLLARLSDLDAPRDAIAIVRRALPEPEDLSPDQPWKLVVYADRVQGPVNLGALARVCAAAGVDLLLTSPGCAHPNHHRAVRGSAYSLLSLPVVPDCSWSRLRKLTRRAASRVALDPRAETSIYDLQLTIPALVVIGGEMGIDPRHLAELETAAIPMPGRVESLNLAVAAGIALFEWVRRAN